MSPIKLDWSQCTHVMHMGDDIYVRMDEAEAHVSGEIMKMSMQTVELAQLRKGARIMAAHILAQPAVGDDALSEVRRVANDVIASSEVQS